jgi:hypothetical protein
MCWRIDFPFRTVVLFIPWIENKLIDSKGEGTPGKLATATQPQFPRKIADF